MAFIERNIIVAMYDFVNESTVIQGVGYHGSLANFTAKYFTSYDFGEQGNTRESNIGVTLPEELQDMVRQGKGKAYLFKVQINSTDLFVCNFPYFNIYAIC